MTEETRKPFGSGHSTVHNSQRVSSTLGNSGAGGGTRTHTTFDGPRILSPVRLPFRHTGNLYLQRLTLVLPLQA